MSNLPPSSQPISSAQTYKRFLTVERYFKSAVLSHPCVVEIDWRLKPTNFSTQRAQLQSSLSSLRRNMHWARPWCDWDHSKLASVLDKLCVRYDPERSQYILLGDAFHMASAYAFSTVRTSFPRRETLYSEAGIAVQEEVTLPSRHEALNFTAAKPLMLETSMDFSELRKVLEAYALLVKNKTANLPKFEFTKASIGRAYTVLIGVCYDNKLQCEEYADRYLIS